MITVIDFQEYLYEMLKGNPKKTLKNAEIYFSKYYKDFLQYYKIQLENMDIMKYSKDSFIYAFQSCLKRSLQAFYKLASKTDDIDKFKKYVYDTEEFSNFNKAAHSLWIKFENLSIMQNFELRYEDYDKYLETMKKIAVDNRKFLQEATNELKLFELEMNLFWNGNTVKIVQKKIENELLKHTGE